MTYRQAEKLADEFTYTAMTEIYRERFTECNDITEDKDMDIAWDDLNDCFYNKLRQWVNE